MQNQTLRALLILSQPSPGWLRFKNQWRPVSFEPMLEHVAWVMQLRCDPTLKAILLVIADNTGLESSATIDRISDDACVSKATVNRHLKRLISSGTVQPKGWYNTERTYVIANMGHIL